MAGERLWWWVSSAESSGGTVWFKEFCRIMVEADLNLAKREKAMLDAGLQENTAGGRP